MFAIVMNIAAGHPDALICVCPAASLCYSKGGQNETSRFSSSFPNEEDCMTISAEKEGAGGYPPHPRHARRERVALAAIILVGMLIRAAVPLLAFSLAHDKTSFHSLDTLSYIEPAQSLISRGDFSRHDKPETIRTPGYPLFLLPGLALHSVEFVTIVLQIIASGFTIYFAYSITRLVTGEPRAGLIAASLFACEPLSIIWTSIVQSETLFATLLMGGVLFWLRYMQRSLWTDMLACSLFLVSAIYVRPAAYFLPVVLALFSMARGLLTRSFSRTLASQTIVFMVLCYAVVGIWQVRNGLVSGYWGFSAVSENNLYFFAATTVMAELTKRPYEEQRRLMIADRPPSPTGSASPSDIPEKELRRYRSAKAVEIILGHPIEYARVVVVSALWTLAGPAIGTWLEVFRLLPPDTAHRATEDDKFYYLRAAAWSRVGSVFLGIVLGIYWCAAFVGAGRMLYDKKWESFLLLLVMAYFVLSPALLCIGYSRFRHPVMPIVSIFAGYGVWFLSTRWLKRRGRLSVPV
uniref:Glycosyltransferase RgtA/B/C/D-like domain-containing protein n=1 Tax=Desulfomonile tiedjei TaxID=2358 RepID=A0A7C4AT12_9BACT